MTESGHGHEGEHSHDHGSHRAHGHAHGHGGHHHHHHATDDWRGVAAVGVNVLLTLAQIVGGIMAGSLSLVADALHNLSDAFSLAIAFAARRIARRPCDGTMTFGYARAEVVAALVNYTTLVVIGLYLVAEGVMRLFQPEPVEGWIVVWIAAIALAIDALTAALTYSLSKESMNIRAAFLHNLVDALASVGVIVAGVLVILFDLWIADAIVTLAIAAYVLWQSVAEIGGAIRILMLASPPDVTAEVVAERLSSLDGVADIHHLHVWMIDERLYALDSHVVIDRDDPERRETVKSAIRHLSMHEFGIRHCTLEVEGPQERCHEDAPQLVGHAARNF